MDDSDYVNKLDSADIADIVNKKMNLKNLQFKEEYNNLMK